MPPFLLRRFASIKFYRMLSTEVRRTKATFGLLFDIDGVLVRSNHVLPDVRETFLRLVDSNKKFRVPTVFVTNAGNKLRQQKASQLTNWLGVEVSEEQVVMAHSPLSLFTPFHNKHALVSGQGPVVDIAKDLGFTNVTTMEKLRDTFPSLDAVNHERYNPAPSALGPYFKPVEVVVLFGEPVRWETSLQLLIDILMTNGLPNNAPNEIIYPHIPVLACNMDLQWMAAACMPRFGHGAFLICLENLYKKITDKDLIYTALIGKPSEITYHHAHQLIIKQAKEIGVADEMKILYAIGDNINTDVYGANLYNRYLEKCSKKEVCIFPRVNCKIDILLGDGDSDKKLGALSCASILVETGVFSRDRSDSYLNHSPRDFLPVEGKLREPTFIVKDVYNAIDKIFLMQNFTLGQLNKLIFVFYHLKN